MNPKSFQESETKSPNKSNPNASRHDEAGGEEPSRRPKIPAPSQSRELPAQTQQKNPSACNPAEGPLSRCRSKDSSEGQFKVPGRWSAEEHKKFVQGNASLVK